MVPPNIGYRIVNGVLRAASPISRIDQSNSGETVMQVIRHSNSANTFFAHNPIIDYSTTRIDESLVGVSKWTEDARMLGSLHSTHDDTVIIVGERGSGKKLIARLIHRNSARRRGPFVSLALGSITEDVARSSLFGSNQNGTTESFTTDKGLLEQA